MGLMPNRLSLALLVLSSAQFGLAAPQLRLSQTAVGPLSVATGNNAPAVAVDAVNAGDGNLNLAVTSSVPGSFPPSAPFVTVRLGFRAVCPSTWNCEPPDWHAARTRA